MKLSSLVVQEKRRRQEIKIRKGRFI